MTSNNIQMNTNEAAMGGMAGTGEGIGSGRRRIGLIITGVVTLFGVIVFVLDMTTNIFKGSNADTFLMVALPFWGGAILLSWILMGIWPCLRKALKLLACGFRFPVWPLNFFAGLMTVMLGGVLILFCPVVIPLMIGKQDN